MQNRKEIIILALVFFAGALIGGFITRYYDGYGGRTDVSDISQRLANTQEDAERAGDRLDDAAGDIDHAGDIQRGAAITNSEIARGLQDLGAANRQDTRSIECCQDIIGRMQERNRTASEILGRVERTGPESPKGE